MKTLQEPERVAPLLVRFEFIGERCPIPGFNCEVRKIEILPCRLIQKN